MTSPSQSYCRPDTLVDFFPMEGRHKTVSSSFGQLRGRVFQNQGRNFHTKYLCVVNTTPLIRMPKDCLPRKVLYGQLQEASYEDQSQSLDEEVQPGPHPAGGSTANGGYTSWRRTEATDGPGNAWGDKELVPDIRTPSLWLGLLCLWQSVRTTHKTLK